MSAAMKDRYGRKIDYLRISVTDRCNLRCRYCMPQEGVPAWKPGQILSFEEIEEITRAAVRLGVRKVRLTGGESGILLGQDKLELTGAVRINGRTLESIITEIVLELIG